MAIKKKTKKKASKPKKSAGKGTPAKASKKRVAKKGTAKKRAKSKSAKGKVAIKKQTPRKSQRSGGAAFSGAGRRSRSGELSGDLQGLSRRESADSESVDELLEEGNAFEADAVLGVEEADLADGKEVRTREVPEDDVPEEYLDQD